MNTIRLPSGRSVRLPVYVQAWRALLTLDPEVQLNDWWYWPVPAHQVLREIRRGVHNRINRHDPDYGKGRKWGGQWQLETQRAARDLNTPRLALHYLPPWLRARYAHRLLTLED